MLHPSMPRALGSSLALAAAALVAWVAPAPGIPTADEAPPLFEGIGPHKRAMTTSSPEAQKYLDQGLTWAYAFNHDEAIRSFAHAAKLDPQCAMAHWGVALCNGPHINNPAMDEEHSVAAWEALKRAEALADGASPVERALIGALAARYADPAAGKLPLTPEERAPYDRAYAEAMKKVHHAYPDDTDVGVLYAEALMDLLPWDLWDHRTGEPRRETPEIIAVLEHVLELDPNHPGAAHLYIHAMEASPTPEKAIAAADVLRTLVPISGHLVHMPGHIDVQVGRWAQASEQNRRAIEADERYRKISPRQGFYRIYMAHNHQFLAWSCMMEGRSEEAISAARAMLDGIPPELLRDQAPLIDGYTPIDIDALIRFGKWDDLLAMEKPPEYLPIRTAMWHFGRGAALAARGETEKADEELAKLREAIKAVPEGAIMTLNPADKVLAIAENTLAGEIALRKGEIDEAVSKLTRAVELEDDLRYIEPPDWIQPVRHSLGAVLLAADRIDEAERVYRKDLEIWPENGWSLWGLAQCLKEKGSPEAAAVEARFKKAWANADTEIHATCLCIPAGD